MKSRLRIFTDMTLLLGLCAGLGALHQLQGSAPEQMKQTMTTPKEHSASSAQATDRASLAWAPDTEQKNADEGSVAEPYEGFTIYPESGTAKVHLVNMSGETVHQWEFDAARARLLPDCSLLVIHGTKWGLDREPWKSLKNTLRIYDWDGTLEWSFEQPGDIHHDVHVLPNGNYLTLHRTVVSPERAARVRNPALRKAKIRSDQLIEVTPEGEVVWRWTADDHLDLNSCGKDPCPKIGKKVQKGLKQFDWTHINTAAPLPENKWHDDGDTRFRPGNVLIMVRNWSTAMIVDRESGEIVWEYTGDYQGGLSYGHEAHMVAPGLPGAGNILIFDNGEKRGNSVALEINPITNKIVWKYENGSAFHSRVAGSMQRLPNGNTLISEDVKGKVMEVAVNGEVVWKYRGNRIRSARAHRYSPGYCSQLASLPLGDSAS